MATGEKRGVSDVELSDNSPETISHPTKLQKVKDIVTQDVTYTATAIQDVYTIDDLQQIPQPDMIKEDLQDWDSPVLLIISRHTRDLYLEFLHKLTTDNKQLLDQTTALSNTSKINENQPNTDIDNSYTKITLEHLATDMAKFNTAYDKVAQKLDKIKQKFTTDELTQDLQTKENFDDFKVMRKSISTYIGIIKNTNKAYKEISTGTSDYICKVSINLIPNKLDKKAVQEGVENIKHSVEQTNFSLMQATIQQGLQDINTLNATIQACPDIILAKAWRCSKKSANYSNIRTTQQQSQSQQQQRQQYMDDRAGYHIPTKQQTTYRTQQHNHYRDEEHLTKRYKHYQYRTKEYSHANDTQPYTKHSNHYQEPEHFTSSYYRHNPETYDYDRDHYTHHHRDYRQKSYYYNQNTREQEQQYHPQTRYEYGRDYLDSYYDLDFPPLPSKQPSETTNLYRRP